MVDLIIKAQEFDKKLSVVSRFLKCGDRKNSLERCECIKELKLFEKELETTLEKM